MVRSALSLAGGEPSFLVEDCPWYVEGHIKTQPEKKRLIFQLLNYDEQKLPVTGVKAKVRVPSGRAMKVFYPDDGQNISFTQEKNYVMFPVRDFEIHEAIVVEY